VVTRRGRYGLRNRQLLQCRPAHAAPHAFAEPSSETLRHFHFPIDEIAHALVLLGRGTSYNLTAYEARERSGRRPSSDTYLPAFWLERFAPTILQELLPQPERLGIVLIDQAPFHVAAHDARGYRIPGGRMRFTVFGAASQPRVHDPLTVLRLGASWRKDIPSWRAFLTAVPGEAELIVCDGEAAIHQTARLRWPDAKLSISEWHVLHRAEEILEKAGQHSRRNPLYLALRHSLRSSSDWKRFVKLARASRLPALEGWIIEVAAVVRGQLRRREHPRSTGALEAKLSDIKKMLTLQRGSYDSLKRLNLLLGLMTLRANHLDRERHYADIIRRSC
jgi:hypothetical protein